MRDVIDGLKNHSTREAKDFVVSRIVGEAQREGTFQEQTCVPIPHSIRGRSTSPRWYLSLLPTEPSKLLITRHLTWSCYGHSHALPILFPRAITDGDLQLR